MFVQSRAGSCQDPNSPLRCLRGHPKTCNSWLPLGLKVLRASCVVAVFTFREIIEMTGNIRDSIKSSLISTSDKRNQASGG